MTVLGAMPPQLAIEAFLARGGTLTDAFSWQEIWQELNATQFTVAKSAGHDILRDLHEALLKAIQEGQTPREFVDEIEPVLRRKGWWGIGVERDPVTGEEVPVRLGSARRLKLIFETNMRVSYAAGHWANFEAGKELVPFLRYVAILDDFVRPQHRALHNLVLPVDHPFWNIFAPPNGWNCRCALQPMTQSMIDKLLAEGEPLRFTPPEITWRPFTNRSTGETVDVPDGVDPGWAYNPGKEGFKVIRERMEARNRRVIE